MDSIELEIQKILRSEDDYCNHGFSSKCNWVETKYQTQSIHIMTCVECESKRILELFLSKGFRQVKPMNMPIGFQEKEILNVVNPNGLYTEVKE